MPEFVFSVGWHTIFRGVAILFALVLIYKAILYKDWVIGFIGVATLLVDSVTFTRSLSRLI